MKRSFTEKKKFRRSFARIKDVFDTPNLIQLQKKSYEDFLQENISPDARRQIGLQEVFTSMFPISDYANKGELHFVSYRFDPPQYDEEECRYKGLTYASPLRAVFRLIIWENDDDTGARSIKDIKEQEVYMCDIPVMTDKGGFIINGVERVVVSQMQRSPGVFFDHDNAKSNTFGKLLYGAHVIPVRGSWLDIEFDVKDTLYIRIDRRRKILATTFLMACYSAKTEKIIEEKGVNELSFDDIDGMSREEILGCFYKNYVAKIDSNGNWYREFNQEDWIGIKVEDDIVNYENDEVAIKSGTKLNKVVLNRIYEKGLRNIKLDESDVIGAFVASDVVDLKTGIVLLEAGEPVTSEFIEKCKENGIKEVKLLAIDYKNVGPYIRNTLEIDKNNCREEALFEIFRILRPGEPPILESAEKLFNDLFFNFDRYDLSVVGRVKMNQRLGMDIDPSVRVLSKNDILNIMKVLHDLRDGVGDIDDIDNLGNRRVRAVGELLENQFRVGLSRVERTIKERMGAVDIDSVMPNELLNSKPISALVREFFGTSQLSQFMDQVNPLSEITHKRRVSALGPGGLTRERAGFEVRDVHPSHYGRLCPVETPEGSNIGLINSLATYARINDYGFIETPYRKVKDGVVTDEVEYLSALNEAKYRIAQANSPLDSKSHFKDDVVLCRYGAEVEGADPSKIDYMDVSTRQLVSVSASMIPFFENDDASRALMGCNMQRQAVPLLKPHAPLVGTGVEKVVARDSGVCTVAKRHGVVEQVDAERIVIKALDNNGNIEGVDIYRLRKFDRSNQSTCINQRPIVKKGDIVDADDIIADGTSTEMGELALGNNVLAAFVSWKGYNYEDAIILSERIVADDVFTSIHIEEFEVLCRDTKLGNEEITRDIPGVSEEALTDIDESGVISIGAKVKAGSILVGKVTPRGESVVSPEEKLLRAIFGERASDVADSSLRVPPGTVGTVVDVKIFSRRGVEKDGRALEIEKKEIEFLLKNKNIEKEILENNYRSGMVDLLKGQVVSVISGKVSKVEKGDVLTEDVLKKMKLEVLSKISVEDIEVNKKVVSITNEFSKHLKNIEKTFESKVEKISRGDELPSGVLKMVKVYLAVKRKIRVGDKMAGRHGNKGVVSRIAPIQDMPFLEDGTPVDIVLNPLGIPSRMNIGQILEIHLGRAARGLGHVIQKTLENMEENEKGLKELRAKLKEIYPKDVKDIDDLNDDEVVELADNITRGVPMATPIFNGATIADIESCLKMAGFDTTGQVNLYDGMTGRKFDKKVTVGVKYMIKLNHMVDDKMHARSIGPYSLVTQQPLGGKAQFGGQRFGEMEVWAIEAYGASYILQEMLTIKSDDVMGRTNAYNAIVSGMSDIEIGIPESFNVLVKELSSLGLNMEFIEKKSLDEELVDTNVSSLKTIAVESDSGENENV